MRVRFESVAQVLNGYSSHSNAYHWRQRVGIRGVSVTQVLLGLGVRLDFQVFWRVPICIVRCWSPGGSLGDNRVLWGISK